MNTVDDKRPSEGAIEPCVVSLSFCDSSNNNSAYWHLLDKVEVGIITKLIETCSHRRVVSDLNEAAGFRNVSYVTKSEISLLERKRCSELNDFVSVI